MDRIVQHNLSEGEEASPRNWESGTLCNLITRDAMHASGRLSAWGS
jgi:hypothetical protein